MRKRCTSRIVTFLFSALDAAAEESEDEEEEDEEEAKLRNAFNFSNRGSQVPCECGLTLVHLTSGGIRVS